jgi:RHS repeat-associated protein
VRHLFTGQQWYQELGLYDLRNRFYSPDVGRFLQPDPIGFRGDRTNLYRYCRNNPVTRWDPFGLDDLPPKKTRQKGRKGGKVGKGSEPSIDTVSVGSLEACMLTISVPSRSIARGWQ